MFEDVVDAVHNAYIMVVWPTWWHGATTSKCGLQLSWVHNVGLYRTSPMKNFLFAPKPVGSRADVGDYLGDN